MASTGMVYLIDPFLLQRPSQEDWPDVIAALTAWASPSAGVTLSMSQNCLATLMSSTEFPYISLTDLRDAFRRGGVQSLPEDALYSLVMRLLGALGYIEASCAGILCDAVSVTPGVIVGRLLPELREDQSNAIIASALLATESSIVLASRPGAGLDDEIDGMASAVVMEAEPQSLLKGEKSILVSAPFGTRFAPPTMIFDENGLLNDAAVALRMAYEALVPDCDKQLYPMRPFRLASSFQTSLSVLAGNPAVLRTLARRAVRILSGQEDRFPALQIHPHLGEGGRQMRRDDGAVAFRAQLTEHNAGYRLLYWKSSEQYELWEIRTEGM